MKNFEGEHTDISLCGLNCLLCTMHMGGYCPGCGGGAGNQGCVIARCGMEHHVEFCSFCPEYPCLKYDGIDIADSFITHLNQKENLEKICKIGVNAYRQEIKQRGLILTTLLQNYNDGRRKNLFATAANLLELSALHKVMEQLDLKTTCDMTIKERAAQAATALNGAAETQGVSLKLRKKK
ncbi:MAG: DUF3795 domain-containing protein [Oscillospiraceae bacterium]|nr:DUF3795 domain-containing protein [Oscillospiraceae bacterium]